MSCLRKHLLYHPIGTCYGAVIDYGESVTMSDNARL